MEAKPQPEQSMQEGQIRTVLRRPVESTRRIGRCPRFGLLLLWE
jgi:hypothetical protein